MRSGAIESESLIATDCCTAACTATGALAVRRTASISCVGMRTTSGAGSLTSSSVFAWTVRAGAVAASASCGSGSLTTGSAGGFIASTAACT